MKRPKELRSRDFSDTIQEPNGWDMTEIPDLTRNNFQKLIDEHNNLVEVVNVIIETLGPPRIKFEGE